MAFPVSSPVVSAAAIVALVASANAAIDNGSNYKELLGMGWGIAQVYALEDELLAQGWQPASKGGKICKVADVEIYYVKGNAKVYALASDYIDSIVAIDVVA